MYKYNVYEQFDNEFVLIQDGITYEQAKYLVMMGNRFGSNRVILNHMNMEVA